MCIRDRSSIASGIASYLLVADNEAGPEVYFGAYTRDKANICFDEAVAQMKDSPHSKKRIRVLNHSVTIALSLLHIYFARPVSKFRGGG